MSVKLIVVALLAATVANVATAADAPDAATTAAEKVVKTTECAGGVAKADTCECDAATSNTFSTTCPKAAGSDNLYWKADTCDDTTAAMVVKGYKKKDCKPGDLTVSAKECKAVAYSKAECDATNVKLYAGCTGEATSCSECQEPVVFAIAADPAECKKWGTKYIKLPASTDCTATDEITFEQYAQAGCTGTKEATDLKIPKACTGSLYYGKASCTAGDKATFKSCPTSDCSAATGCTDVEVKLGGKYETKLNGETLSLATCPAADADVKFDVYAGVKEYKNECTGSATAGYAKATCAAVDVLTIKTCADATDCGCDASDSNTEKYTVGTCVTKDSKHWMVSSCDDKVVKGYTSDKCEQDTFTVQKECRALAYHKAECTAGATSGDLKLFAGCTADTCTGDSETGCKTPTTFTIGKATPECKKAGTKFYKLTSTTCPEAGASPQSVTFTQHKEAGCTDAGTSVTVPLTCEATGSHKVTCTADAGATFEVCSDKNCANDCKTTKVPLKEYTVTPDGNYLYIDACPADSAKELTFEVYAAVKPYKLGCNDNVEAKCGDKPVQTTSTTTSTTTTSTTESTAESNTTNNTTDDGMSLAPAHSVGALALVLCLLACLY